MSSRHIAEGKNVAKMLYLETKFELRSDDLLTVGIASVLV